MASTALWSVALFVWAVVMPSTASENHQREGDECTMDSGTLGVCKRLAHCQWAVMEKRRGRHPTLCDHRGEWPVVCCRGRAKPTTAAPVEAAVVTGNRFGVTTAAQDASRIARKKCDEYAAFVFVEGLSTSSAKVDQCAILADELIVGGRETKPMEFPHMALIGYETSPDSIAWTCGGSLISENFVLSAAHCTSSGRTPAGWVLLGELDRSTDTDDALPQQVRVIDRVTHPEYNPPAKYHDIALLRLARRAALSPYVRPACLDTQDPAVTARGREAPVASGWGHNAYGGDPVDHLNKVRLPLVEPDVCKKGYSNLPAYQLPRGILADSQVCAGGVTGKDTCQGDSGGPLQLPTREDPHCMYRIVGVTSFGKACGLNVPGVYTRVYHYVPWIEDIVWPRRNATAG
ncbi:Serine protease snake [Frankliniella fusca]|uniref:Serine protease snake n=1 Tax=Frankliniella fusca TaxID=407009 RepID=A0AAE1H432_9NEOP|nr:Serine protease snake [Frankliniella fusca]